MYQAVRILVVLSVFMFLFLGIANAEPVAVVSPNGGETLTSGQAWTVSISINYGEVLYKPAKYRLSYWCRDPEVEKSWKTIVVRDCSPIIGCYPTYLWEVPSVERYQGDVRKCKVRVDLYNANGAIFARDVSDTLFNINPYEPIPIL